MFEDPNLEAPAPTDPTLVMTQALPVEAPGAAAGEGRGAAAAAPPVQSRRRRRAPIWWIMVGLMALFVLVGLGSIGLYAYLTFRPPEVQSGTTAWDSLQPSGILPGPAVSLLSGARQDKTYRETMAVDAIETATAQAIANTDVTESQRIGWLEVLARRYALKGERSRATELYQLAADLAILDPDLGDHQRASTLLSVARGWVLLGQADRAKAVLAQVALIASSSPQLEPPVRRQLVEQSASIYDRIGDVEGARRARALPLERPAEAPVQALDPLRSILASPLPEAPQTVVNAENARRVQAQAFVDGWLASNGAVPRGQAQALEAALRDEDLVRSAFYDQSLANVSLSPLDRAEVQWDQIEWLVLKHRVASDLYGLSLSPGWTDERPAIRQSLQDALGRLGGLVNQYLQTLGPEQQGEATYNYYRRALQWARIGLYPDADQVFLANAMNDALLQWQQAKGLNPIAVIDGDGTVRFEMLDATSGTNAN